MAEVADIRRTIDGTHYSIVSWVETAAAKIDSVRNRIDRSMIDTYEYEPYGVLFNTRLREEANKRLVGGPDEHELERIAVEEDALEEPQDGMEDSTAGN